MRRIPGSTKPTAKPVVKAGVSTVPTKTEVPTALESQSAELQAKLAELAASQSRLIESERLHAEKVMQENAAFSAREKEIAAREKWIAQREAAVNQKEQQQSERDHAFQTEYAERIAELHRAVEDFNEKVKALDLRVAELRDAEAAVTARETQLTARSGAVTARRRHLPVMPSAAPTPREETAERVKSWYEMHYPVVSDSRPTAWIYSEKTKKEMNTGEAKIAYLKKVIRDIPEEVSEDHLQSMIHKIQENRELPQDALFALKIQLIQRMNHYIAYPNAQDRTKSFFSGFFSAEIVSVAEEMNRAIQVRSCLLHLENQNDLTALEAIKSILTEAEKLIDPKKWKFSETFAACLQECRETVASYQPVAALSNPDECGFQ